MDKFADSINYTVRLAESDDYTKIKECFHSGNTMLQNQDRFLDGCTPMYIDIS